jgi:uncharacterized membrane protein YfcA
MTELALHLAAFLAAGLLGGVLLGLIGVGMALITVPLLIFLLPGLGFAVNEVPLVALATSMAVVTVGSVSSVISHHRKGNVDWQVVRITVPASLCGIALGTLGASHLPGAVLRVLFCLFLIYIAARMLWGASAKAAHATPTQPLTYRLAGAAIGAAASVIGAGGGVLMVPFLSQRGHPMPREVATSTMIGLPVSALGAVIYAAQPAHLPQPMMLGYLYLPAFAGLAVGSALGAPLGTRLGGKLPAPVLKKGFAVALLLVALAILLDL